MYRYQLEASHARVTAQFKIRNHVSKWTSDSKESLFGLPRFHSFCNRPFFILRHDSQFEHMNSKIIITTIILASAICFVPFVSDDSAAISVNDGTFIYELDEPSSQATVIGLMDSMVKNIPSTIRYESKTYNVVAIGDNAFQNEKLTGNMNTGSVRTIGAGAFQGADITGNLNISSAVTSIGDSAFEKADITGNFNISNGLKTIGNSAFRSSEITGNLNLPSTVQSIGDYAFAETDFTGNLRLPSSLTTIGNYAFYKSEFTGNLNLGDRVTSVGDYAFAETKLTGNLNLGDSVKTIGEGAFKNCDFTGNIDIPSSVTSIGSQAFTCSSSISSITISSSSTVIDSQTFSSFVFYASDGVTILSQTSSNLCGHTFVKVNGKMVMQDGGTIDPTPDPDPSVKYTITIYSDTPGWGEIDGAGTYSSGSKVTISASPNDGYSFVGWSDGVTSSHRTITVSGDATFVAIFEPNNIVEPAGSGAEYPYTTIGMLMWMLGGLLLVVFVLLYIRHNRISKRGL